MKYNYKQYVALTSESLIEVQKFGNKTVEIHSLEKTDFLNSHIAKGMLSSWSAASDNEYKLLVEEGFYHEMADYFCPEINDKWTDTLREVITGSRKITMMCYIPILVIAALFFVAWLIFPEQLQGIGSMLMLGLLVVFLVVMMGSNRFQRKKINILMEKFSNYCIELLTEERYKELAAIQSRYYPQYIEKLNNQRKALYDEENEDGVEVVAIENSEQEAYDAQKEEFEIEEAVLEEQETVLDNKTEDK